MFLGYAFQTFALTYTYSSTVGFITGLSVIVVPFASYLIFRHKASIYSVLGAIILAIGLYYLTLNSEIGFSLGEFYAFICAMMFALHIVLTIFPKDTISFCWCVFSFLRLLLFGIGWMGNGKEPLCLQK